MSAMRVRKLAHCDAELMQIVQAIRASHGFVHLKNRRQQDRREYRDYRHDDQQFHQREPSPHISLASSRHCP